MRYIRFTIATGSLLASFPAYPIPSLLPLMPLMVALIVKGALLIGSVFFLLMSYTRKHRTLYLAIGIVLFIIFVLAMVFVRDA